MPRGYRCVVVAAVGWLMLANATNEHREPKAAKSVTARDIRESTDILASALKEANKTPKSDPGCDPDKEDRHSDLCAQWKAADAAKGSFWTSVVALGIGGLTLIAAGLAALYAKRAAAAAEKSHQASVERDKPRLVITLTDFDDQNLFHRFNITATNVGGAGCVVTRCFHNWGERDDHPDAFTGTEITRAIAPGQSVVLDLITLSISQPPDQRVLLVYISYEGPFLGEETQWVGYGFHVFPKITFPHRTHYMPLDAGYADRQRPANDDNSHRADQ